MQSVSNLKLLTLSSALALLLMAADAQAAKGSFQQTLKVDEPILLDVSTGSGTIVIRAGNSEQVEVKGKITASRGWFFSGGRRSSEENQDLVDRFEAEPPVKLDGRRLRVGHIKDKSYRRNVSISYEITVPASTEVKSHTGSGAQHISGVAGPVEVGTGSGKLTLTNIGSAVIANTGSGAIYADEIAGAFEAHTGSGDVRLTQVSPGDVVVSTGSGSSDLRGVVGALSVRAGSGRVKIDGRQEGPWKIDTGSGTVRINLPEDAAFNLDAETGSGDIVLDHPLTIQGKISKRRLRGEVRGGGALLAVETGSGGIRIE